MHKIYRSSVINMETAIPIIVHTLNTESGGILPVFEAPDTESREAAGKIAGDLNDTQSDGPDNDTQSNSPDNDPEVATTLANDRVSAPEEPDPAVLAAELIAKAEQDAVKISQDAFREGYSEGLEQGLHDMETAIKSAETKIKKIFDDLAVKQEDVLNSIRKDILELACDIAEKILEYELDRSDAYLTLLLNNAVNQLKDDSKAVIKLCVNDYLNALPIIADLRNSSGKRQQIELVDDTAASKGDCIVEFENGTIDCGITTKLNNAKRLLDTEETAQI